MSLSVFVVRFTCYWGGKRRGLQEEKGGRERRRTEILGNKSTAGVCV